MVAKKRKPNRQRNTGRQDPAPRGGKDTDDPDDDDDPDDPDDDDDDDDDDEPSISQKDFDRIVTREKVKAARQAAKALATELGFADVDAMKAAIAKSKTPPKPKDKGDKDDDEATTPTAEEIRAELEAEHKKELAAQKLTDTIKDILTDDFDLSRKQTSAIRRMVEVDTDAEEDDIIEALEELEDELPNLFTVDSEDGEDGEEGAQRSRNRRERRPSTKPRRSSDPGRSPSRKRKPANVQTAARTLLHERYPHLKKT